MTRADEAQAMISAFASVGAATFYVTLTDIKGDPVPARYYPPWMRPHPDTKRLPVLPLDTLRSKIESVLEEAERKQHNVIIRPRPSTTALHQLDDLKLAQVKRITPFAFIAFQTSPGNYQAWVAVKDVPADQEQAKAFARRLRKGAGGADKSATRSTRIAGSLNFKAAYAPSFPVVTITHAKAGNITSTAALEEAGFLPIEEQTLPPARAAAPIRNFPRRAGTRKFPSYTQALALATKKADGTPDRSMADFLWCKWAIERGWSRDETAAKLPEVSAKAHENARSGDKGYAQLTARNAAARVERESSYRKSAKAPPRPP